MEIRLPLSRTCFILIRDKHTDKVLLEIKPYYQSKLCKNYKKYDYHCTLCANISCKPVLKSNDITFTLGLPRQYAPGKYIIASAEDIIKERSYSPYSPNPGKKQFVIKLGWRHVDGVML